MRTTAASLSSFVFLASVLAGTTMSALTGCGGDTAGQPPAPVTENPAPAPAAEATLFAYVPQHPQALRVVGGQVFFTTKKSILGGEPSDNGQVMTLDKNGQVLSIALDRFGAGYEALASDGQELVWSTSDGRVMAVSVRGGDARTLNRGEPGIVSLAVDASYVYVARDNAGAGSVSRIPRQGGEPETILEGLVRPRGIAVGAAGVYVAMAGNGKKAGVIHRIDAQTLARTIVAEGQNAPCGIVADRGKVIWTNAGEGAADGTVMGLTGTTATALATGQAAPCTVTTDADSAYWAPSSTLRAPLMKAKLAGGSPIAVALDGAATVSTDLGTVAVDEQFVYWATDTAILRAKK